MNEFIRYINLQPAICKAYYVVGTGFSLEKLSMLLNGTSLEQVTMVGCFDRDNKKDIQDMLERDYGFDRHTDIRFITPDELLKTSFDDTSALIFDDLDRPEDCLNFVTLKPKYLFGVMKEGYLTAFKVWENYRNSAEHIIIITWRDNAENKVLEWQKDPVNPIELSVVFPMYNVAQYLDECIDGLLQWKADYVEYIFVNDGSPDNSRDVVLKWAEKDSRIKLFDKENGGCASARQFGIDHSKGKYLGFVDPDDFVDPSMFCKLLSAAMIGSYDISYCGYYNYYNTTKTFEPVQDALAYPYCMGVYDPKIVHQLIAYCRVAIWRGIYRREMLETNNIHFYQDLKRFDDLPFKVETFTFTRSVIAIPEYLYYYRLSRPGQDVSANDERLFVHFDIFKHLNDSVGSKKDQRINDLLQICKIQTHIFALSKIKDEYFDEYMRRAKEDLDTLGKGKRIFSLFSSTIGEKRALIYEAIEHHNVRLAKLLISQIDE